MDPKEGGFCRKGGHVKSLGIFSGCGVANVTTATFNYILVKVFLFPLNVGVSPCFHCSFSSCLQGVFFLFPYQLLVSSYRLHTSCLHYGGFTSCFSLKMF